MATHTVRGTRVPGNGDTAGVIEDNRASRRADARAGGASAAGASEASPLGTLTHNLSGPGRTWYGLRRKPLRKRDKSNPKDRQCGRDEARDERWRLRRAFRSVTESKRVRACGRPGAREDGSVVLRVTDATGTAAQKTTGADGRVAGFAGLFHCANVWLCPECSQRIAAKRAEELERVLAYHIERGRHPYMFTCTMRHYRGHALAACLKAAGKAWQAVISGRTWQAHKRLGGFVGYARALEITQSPENGWHVHFHVVIVFDHELSEDTLSTIADGMFSRWSAALVRAGFPAPTREYGLDVMGMDKTAGKSRKFATAREWARYVCKGIAAEAVLGATKEAKGQNRTVRQLMTDALLPQVWETADGKRTETVDDDALRLLREYEQATKGRKQLTWSTKDHDLRTGVIEQKTDEEIAAEALEGEDVAVLPRETWEAVEPRAPELLSVTESGGPAAARAWLDERGLPWWKPTRLTDQKRHGEAPGT